MKQAREHTLEFLLAFDGHRHWFKGGYFAKYEIRRVEADRGKPHGLKYSFTLHAPDGMRLLGFDNAHGAVTLGSSFKRMPEALDHWHRTVADPGRPYDFKDAEQLIADFLSEVERALKEREVPPEVIAVDVRS